MISVYKKLLATVVQYWWQCSLAILIAITVLSLSPLEHLPKVSGSDKTHHFIAYASLMLPVALRQPKNWIWLGVLFIGYSGMIELLQPFSNRYAEWLDLLANAGGVGMGAVIGIVMHRLTHVRDSQ